MANKNTIYCNHCADEITSRGDLVTTLQLPDLVGAYHVRCYGEEASKGKGAGIPLNSPAMIWEMVILISFCLVVFAFAPSPIWLVFAAFTPVARLLSWWLVERHIART